MRWLSLVVAAACLLTAGAPAFAEPVRIVAAENFYGDLARQIGRDLVSVDSVLSSPDQDPHLFEASPSTARALAAARIVIVNGADYDPWMDKLLAGAKGAARETIVAAALVGKKSGDNPHIWYDPATMKAVARRLADLLATVDPGHKADYAANAAAFMTALQPLDAKIADMKRRFAGSPVTASEPVFGYMAQALGLAMRNERFQLAMQNDAEPRISDIAAFQGDLKGRKVKAMLFNKQAGGPTAKRLVDLAKASGVPVVGVTETAPAGKTYQDWMLDQLAELETALAGAAK